MRPANGLLQVGDLDASVALSRLKRVMAQELLDVPDIGSTSKEMGSDAVAKRMTGDVFFTFALRA